MTMADGETSKNQTKVDAAQTPAAKTLFGDNPNSIGFLCIFYSIMDSPLRLWDKQERLGEVKRIIDEDWYPVLELASSPNKYFSTFITSPAHGYEKLGIKLKHLILVLKNMTKAFAFTVLIRDECCRRRLHFCTCYKTARVKSLVAHLPLFLEKDWNEIVLDLATLTKSIFGTEYLETLRIQIHANCRLRMVYFSAILLELGEAVQILKAITTTPTFQKKSSRVLISYIDNPPSESQTCSSTSTVTSILESEPIGAPAAKLVQSAPNLDLRNLNQAEIELPESMEIWEDHQNMNIEVIHMESECEVSSTSLVPSSMCLSETSMEKFCEIEPSLYTTVERSDRESCWISFPAKLGPIDENLEIMKSLDLQIAEVEATLLEIMSRSQPPSFVSLESSASEPNVDQIKSKIDEMRIKLNRLEAVVGDKAQEGREVAVTRKSLDAFQLLGSSTSLAYRKMKINRNPSGILKLPTGGSSTSRLRRNLSVRFSEVIQESPSRPTSRCSKSPPPPLQMDLDDEYYESS